MLLSFEDHFYQRRENRASRILTFNHRKRQLGIYYILFNLLSFDAYNTNMKLGLQHDLKLYWTNIFLRKIFCEGEKITANCWLYLLSIGTFSGMGLIPGAKSPTTTVRIGALTTHSIKAWPLHSKVVWSQNRKSFRAITSFVSSVLKSKSSMPRIYQSDSCQNHDIPQEREEKKAPMNFHLYRFQISDIDC